MDRGIPGYRNKGSLTLSIELPGWVQYWEGVMRDAPRIVAQEINDALEDNAQLVRDQARENLRNNESIDTHTLFNSLGYKVYSRPRRYATVGSNARHAATVERGRRAGAPMPPAGVLLGWMERHNIPAEYEYVIRRSIARRGIKPKPYLGPALESTRRDQAMRWKRAVRNIGNRTFLHKRRFA